MMKVVQIIGPAYCGSTALGYALNTIPGFFFGSEVLLLLKSLRSGKEGDLNYFLRCNNCGSQCQYWSDEFYRTIKQTDSLQELYDKFSDSYPEVEFFVDASKRFRFFNNTQPFAKVICAKHPFRMLASHLYNKRKLIGIDADAYECFFNQVNDKQDELLELSSKYFLDLISLYDKLFQNTGEHFYLKTDLAHEDGFFLLDEVKNYLGVAEREIDVQCFSKYTCHSIGGNRAPIHLAKKQKSANQKSNPRFNYYDKAENFGDWKIDNKYKELLPEEFRNSVCKTSEYKQLKSLLDYVGD